MRKIAVAFSAMFLVTVVAPGVTLGAANGTDRPYADSGSAILSINLATLEVALAGTRNATHLGLSTAEASNVTIDLSQLGQNLIGVIFDNTITAADGDELYTTAAATIDITPILSGGTSLPFSDVEDIAGGTGRFEGASGSFGSTGSVTLNLATGTGVLTFTSTGTISY
jgi:hypothetical protein